METRSGDGMNARSTRFFDRRVREKFYKKVCYTREKSFFVYSESVAARDRETFGTGGLKISCSSCHVLSSFEALNLFTSYSHSGAVLPGGAFRVETAPPPHKKKSELYFALWSKKFLTENHVWHVANFHS
jgi:hypothetical protein